MHQAQPTQKWIRSQFSLGQLMQFSAAFSLAFGAWSGHSSWPAQDDTFAVLMGFAILLGLRTLVDLFYLGPWTRYVIVVGVMTLVASITVFVVGPYEFPFSC